MASVVFCFGVKIMGKSMEERVNYKSDMSVQFKRHGCINVIGV